MTWRRVLSFSYLLLLVFFLMQIVTVILIVFFLSWPSLFHPTLQGTWIPNSGNKPRLFFLSKVVERSWFYLFRVSVTQILCRHQRPLLGQMGNREQDPLHLLLRLHRRLTWRWAGILEPTWRRHLHWMEEVEGRRMRLWWLHQRRWWRKRASQGLWVGVLLETSLRIARTSSVSWSGQIVTFGNGKFLRCLDSVRIWCSKFQLSGSLIRTQMTLPICCEADWLIWGNKNSVWFMIEKVLKNHCPKGWNTKQPFFSLWCKQCHSYSIPLCSFENYGVSWLGIDSIDSPFIQFHSWLTIQHWSGG